MNFKKISFIVVIVVFTGFVALLGIKIFLGKQDMVLRIPQTTKQSSPSPTPKPTLPPIDQNSSLENEMDKLSPADYSERFSNLRGDISQF